MLLAVLCAVGVGCGDDSEPAQEDGTAESAQVEVPPGSDIPSTTVRLGMQPFGDQSIYVQGIRRGYFDDVGIEIAPAPLGESVPADKVVARLVSKDLDIVSWYGSLQVQSMGEAPDVTMLGFSDTYVGTHIMAAPETNAKGVQEIMKEEGKSFEEAMKVAMPQLDGKKVALTDNGGHRAFFNTTFDLGGISFDDVDLTSLSDARQVELAKGGQIQFAAPAGAAQTVALFELGWTSVVGVRDLLENLPPGDPKAVLGVGHTGPGALKSWYEDNKATTLRFMSVMFRILDDLEQRPEWAVKDQVAYLKSVTGVDLDAPAIVTMYRELDPMTPFEDQEKYWTDTGGRDHFATIYEPQIEAAQEGGVLPQGESFSADDVTIGPEIYEALVKLKEDYDGLMEGSAVEDLSGGDADLAKQAAEQYENRNYLDAYRMLKTALDGAQG
jgi:ABC-type nitrate/sulfonate/bicarbonate transport system substrate-binding protein